MAPTRGIVKAVNVAAQAFLRTRVEGGRRRGRSTTPSPSSRPSTAWRRASATGPTRCSSCSSDDVTAFVLVAAPRRDIVEEATFFAAKLAEAGIPVRALIVNRMHPSFGDGLARGHRASGPARSPAPTSAGSTPTWPTSSTWRRARRSTSPAWPSEVAPAPVVRVPFLRTDVHDLDGLAEIGDVPVPRCETGSALAA